MNIPAYTHMEVYEEYQKQQYRSILLQLGDSIDFNEDRWICNKRIKSPSEPMSYCTIYFTNTPSKFKEFIKYYILIRIANGDTIKSVKGRVSRINILMKFIVEKNIEVYEIKTNTALKFKEYLLHSGYSNNTIHDVWMESGMLMRTMNGFNGYTLKNPFAINPFIFNKKQDYKYIPECIAIQLDRIFKDENIDLYIRCIYWILRLIPSRISEVLGIKIDCLKPYNGHWVLFIPTWKQNGGNMEPIYRTIHIEDKDIGGYLISLIRKQQKLAISLQKQLPTDKQGMLFTYQRVMHYRDGSSSTPVCIKNATVRVIENQLKRICISHNLKDENGQPYYVTPHQFRHNGITDRLEAGFTLEQIADMTGHHGNAMIWNSYSHLDLKPKTIIEKQQYVMEKPKDDKKPYVLFGGRVLNMDEQTEKRLLKNIRALKVQGGICSDVMGCKSDMWNCLECEHFIPDSEQFSYFEEQTQILKNKAIRFQNYPIIRDNALKNAKLFETVVGKIKGVKSDE